MSTTVTPDLRVNETRQLSTQRLITVLGPYIGLALVLIIFSIPSDVRVHFLTLGNMRTVATQTVIVGLCALGMTLIIISGGIDLSVGSVIALTSVVAALLLHAHCTPILAVLGAVLAGGVVGMINGSLITGLRVTPFIVTLGTMGIARGVAEWIAKETTVNAPTTWINNLTATTPTPAWLVLSPSLWVTVAFAIATAALLKFTVLGRYIFAIGSNETTSRLSGLKVDRLKIAIYAIAGLFFGLAGAMQFSTLSLGDPTSANGLELDVIAAVVIGGASLNGGEGSVMGSIIGALIMSLLRNGSQQMGWEAYVEKIIIGSVIIAAVALDRLRHRTSTH